jgi:hypothetical protein
MLSPADGKSASVMSREEITKLTALSACAG